MVISKIKQKGTHCFYPLDSNGKKIGSPVSALTPLEAVAAFRDMGSTIPWMLWRDAAKKTVQMLENKYYFSERQKLRIIARFQAEERAWFFLILNEKYKFKFRKLIIDFLEKEGI